MDFLDAYMERRQAELDELDAEIKTFEFKASNVPADRQMQFYDDLQALRAAVRHHSTEARRNAESVRPSAGRTEGRFGNGLEGFAKRYATRSAKPALISSRLHQETTMQQAVADPSAAHAMASPRKVDELTFRGSPEATLGVELELMVLDRDTGNLVSGAAGILKGCAEEATVRDFVSAELMQSMIEVKTGVCHERPGSGGRPVSRPEAGAEHRPLDGF